MTFINTFAKILTRCQNRQIYAQTFLKNTKYGGE